MKDNEQEKQVSVFQKNLKRFREEADLTARDLVRAFVRAKGGDVNGSSFKTMYARYKNYENKGIEPKYEDLCLIADILNKSVDELLGRVSQFHEVKQFYTYAGYTVQKIGYGMIMISLPHPINDSTDNGFILKYGSEEKFLEEALPVYNRFKKTFRSAASGMIYQAIMDPATVEIIKKQNERYKQAVKNSGPWENTYKEVIDKFCTGHKPCHSIKDDELAIDDFKKILNSHNIDKVYHREIIGYVMRQIGFQSFWKEQDNEKREVEIEKYFTEKEQDSLMSFKKWLEKDGPAVPAGSVQEEDNKK